MYWMYLCKRLWPFFVCVGAVVAFKGLLVTVDDPEERICGINITQILDKGFEKAANVGIVSLVRGELTSTTNSEISRRNGTQEARVGYQILHFALLDPCKRLGIMRLAEHVSVNVLTLMLYQNRNKYPIHEILTLFQDHCLLAALIIRQLINGGLVFARKGTVVIRKASRRYVRQAKLRFPHWKTHFRNMISSSQEVKTNCATTGGVPCSNREDYLIHEFFQRNVNCAGTVFGTAISFAKGYASKVLVKTQVGQQVHPALNNGNLGIIPQEPAEKDQPFELVSEVKEEVKTVSDTQGNPFLPNRKCNGDTKSSQWETDFADPMTVEDSTELSNLIDSLSAISGTDESDVKGIQISRDEIPLKTAVAFNVGENLCSTPLASGCSLMPSNVSRCPQCDIPGKNQRRKQAPTKPPRSIKNVRYFQLQTQVAAPLEKFHNTQQILTPTQRRLLDDLSKINEDEKERFFKSNDAVNRTILLTLDKQRDMLAYDIAVKRRNSKKFFRRVLKIFRKSKGRTLQRMEDMLEFLNQEIRMARQKVEEFHEFLERAREEEPSSKVQRESVQREIHEGRRAIVECVREAFDLRAEMQGFNSSQMPFKCYDCSVGTHPRVSEHVLPCVASDLFSTYQGYSLSCPIVQNINARFSALDINAGNVSDDDKLCCIQRLKAQIERGLFCNAYLISGRFVQCT